MVGAIIRQAPVEPEFCWIRRDSLLVVPSNSIVDCDLPPNAPVGWSVGPHRAMGKVKLERKENILYADSKRIILLSKALVKKFKKQPLNACFADHLFRHPELVPEEWELVSFRGTTFLDPNNNPFVACLEQNERGIALVYSWVKSITGLAACLE